MGLESNRSFHLMIKPIGPICNLNCDYCFYLEKEHLFDHSNKNKFIMDDDTLRTYIKEYVKAQPPGCKEITFAWQGGEPTLLHIDFYKKALEYQQKYIRQGMTIQNSLQTNGTLINEEWSIFFSKNNFLIGISVDGPEELHNRYRKNRNMEGSFKQVTGGLELLKYHNVEFNTLTVVQDNNSRYPEKVYEFLKSIGSKYLQFIPIVGVRSVTPEGWGNFMISVFNQWAKEDIGEIFIGHFDMLLGIYMSYPSSLCVHSETCGDAMALEHNGNVYSCDHFVDEDNELGNLLETSLAEMVESRQQRAFGNNKRDNLPEDCINCNYLKLCWGGCPKNRLENVKGEKINYLCKGYLKFYKYTQPYFTAMAAALKQGYPASDFRRFLQFKNRPNPGRNDLCLCLSGRKFKNCCGRQ